MKRERERNLEAKYYHVISRGNGKQVVFEDRLDRQYFLNLMKDYKEDHQITIIAYCLMDNHVHLLIGDPQGNQSGFMREVLSRYARVYNKKYEHCGGVFEARFGSEPVQTRSYMLNVFRYILKNPQKARIAPYYGYEWNSYEEFVEGKGLTDASVIRSICARDGINAFEFLKQGSDREDVLNDVMEYDRHKHGDEWASAVICETCHIDEPQMMKLLPKMERDEYIRQLRRKKVSQKQIERLGGISKGVIQRAGNG